MNENPFHFIEDSLNFADFVPAAGFRYKQMFIYAGFSQKEQDNS